MAAKKTTQKRGQKRVKVKEVSVSVVHPNAAGIDIGANEIYVAVPSDRDENSVRCFSSFTESLEQIGKWLKQCRVTTVAMESTGVYWIALYQILEDQGFEVYLVNAREVRNVPGRKSDVQDCQWLQTLHTNGLLRASFRPSEETCAIRSIYRHRKQLVESSSCYIQHIQKALSQMNIQLHHVLSDITGTSGLAILDAIIAGERDPKVLAKLSHSRVRQSRETIEKSLMGNWQVEHLFTLAQSVELYRVFQRKIEACDQQMYQMMGEVKGQTEQSLLEEDRAGKKGTGGLLSCLNWENHLYRIFGVNLLTVPGVSVSTALVWFSEVGTDLSRFKSVHHFCSWLRLSPQNKISGGKVLSSRTPSYKPNLALALRMGVSSLSHNKSALGDQFRRLKAKLGAPKAITAMAHRVARILFTMLIKKQAYNENLISKNEGVRLIKKQNWLQKELKSVTQSLSHYQQLAKQVT